MKKAAAYIRVSTDEQTEFSPSSQIRKIRLFAEEKNYCLPDEFIFRDEGISGRNAENRPEFMRMISTAKAVPRPFDVIIVWKFSRFARNREDSIIYKSILRKQCGIDVISVSEQLSDDNSAVLMEAIYEAMDEFYSLNLAEEVKRGMNEKFISGGIISQPPFGYKVNSGMFLPDENAETVRKIFSDFINGNSYRKIAEKLNICGIRTSRGNFFESRNIEYIISNPVYTGKLRRSTGKKTRFHENAETVRGMHKPLISEEIFAEAQKRRRIIKNLYPPFQKSKPAEYMLKGLVRCSDCGGILCLQRKNNSLQCHNYAKGKCMISHSVKLEKINQIITEKILSDMGDITFEINIHQKNIQQNSPEFFHSLAEKEKKKLIRIKSAYENGIDTIEEYRENKEKILRRIQSLEKNLREINSDITLPENKTIKTSISEIIKGNYPEQIKNIILRCFTDRIIFDRQNNTIEIYYKSYP